MTIPSSPELGTSTSSHFAGLEDRGQSQAVAFREPWPTGRRHGRALHYLSSDKHIMEVPYSEEGNSFVPEAPRAWSEVPIPYASFNLSPDGARAIILVPADPGTPRRDLHVTFLLNFSTSCVGAYLCGATRRASGCASCFQSADVHTCARRGIDAMVGHPARA